MKGVKSEHETLCHIPNMADDCLHLVDRPALAQADEACVRLHF